MSVDEGSSKGRGAPAGSDSASAPLAVLPEWAAGSTRRRGLEGCLGRLTETIAAAGGLGIDTASAEAVRVEAGERLGFPADVYVLAFVGGTGVGKSSLLNALAGEPVSTASVRRPTTAEPVAWVPASERAELAGLLAWLGVTRIEEHGEARHGPVAILDLPDMDSIEPDHRTKVEAILPRVDAVAWVTDPEKYHDAVLHDDFLRRWMPRLDHQAIVLNKSDRLAGDDAQRIRRALEADVARDDLVPGTRRPPVLVASTRDGEEGLEEVRAWLAHQVESKRIVRARLAASISAVVDGLARTAGVEPSARPSPFLEAADRRVAIDAATTAVLRAIDLPALERQAEAATRAEARAKGTGPIGLVTSTVYRLSGRAARVADPDGFLVRWRDRGSLVPAAEPLRQALTAPIARAAPAVRAALAASVEPRRLASGLATAVDRAVRRHDESVPSSRWWPVLGLLQSLTTVALILSVAWVVIWILARPPVDDAVLPLIGRVPIPFVALIVTVIAGYVLGRGLGIHAGWLGRRWARRLAASVRESVEREVADGAFGPLDRLEAARRSLWLAARATRDDCGRG